VEKERIGDLWKEEEGGWKFRQVRKSHNLGKGKQVLLKIPGEGERESQQ